MLHRVIIRLAPAFLILASLFLWLGPLEYKRDPFSSYRDFEKKPLNITEPAAAKHYGAEEALIRSKLKLELSRKEKTILAGFHWILGLVDDNDAFAFLFPDFMLFMDKMSVSYGREHQKELADLIIKKSFARAAKDLDKLFNDEDMSRWRFLGLFPILLRHPEFKQKYFSFYEKKWPQTLTKNFYIKDLTLEQAMKEQKYRSVFDYLVWPSFLHYYLAQEKNSKIITPADKFPEYLEQFKSFNYADHTLSHDAFRELGYLATHVVLALTNYGQLDLKPSEVSKKVHEYINASFEKTYDLGDFDLYAEYIQCLKIMSPEDKKIPELEEFLYDLQRPDGSWGSERDFSTNPYTAIHPGGAALMALNQPSK